MSILDGGGGSMELNYPVPLFSIDLKVRMEV